MLKVFLVNKQIIDEKLLQNVNGIKWQKIEELKFKIAENKIYCSKYNR